MAQKYPAQGDFVATIALAPDQGGLCTARWGAKGHMSLWGEPLTLLLCLTDIVRVDRRGDA